MSLPLRPSRQHRRSQQPSPGRQRSFPFPVLCAAPPPQVRDANPHAPASGSARLSTRRSLLVGSPRSHTQRPPRTSLPKLRPRPAGHGRGPSTPRCRRRSPRSAAASKSKSKVARVLGGGRRRTPTLQGGSAAGGGGGSRRGRGAAAGGRQPEAWSAGHRRPASLHARLPWLVALFHWYCSALGHLSGWLRHCRGGWLSLWSRQRGLCLCRVLAGAGLRCSGAYCSRPHDDVYTEGLPSMSSVSTTVCYVAGSDPWPSPAHLWLSPLPLSICISNP